MTLHWQLKPVNVTVQLPGSVCDIQICVPVLKEKIRQYEFSSKVNEGPKDVPVGTHALDPRRSLKM